MYKSFFIDAGGSEAFENTVIKLQSPEEIAELMEELDPNIADMIMRYVKQKCSVQPFLNNQAVMYPCPFVSQNQCEEESDKQVYVSL